MSAKFTYLGFYQLRPMIRWFLLLAIFSLCTACRPDDPPTPPPPKGFSLKSLDKPVHYSGIPLLTNDMARNQISDVNAEMFFSKDRGVTFSSEIMRNKFNAVMKMNFEGISQDRHAEVLLAIHGGLTKRKTIPDVYKENTTGLAFNAQSIDEDVELVVQTKNISNIVVQEETFLITQDSLKRYQFSFSKNDYHHFNFVLKGTSSQSQTGSLVLDEVYLASNTTFIPPKANDEFLTWLKQSSLRFFLDNYEQVNSDRGVVYESYLDDEKISISGISFALAAFHLAEQEQMISSVEAKEKTQAVLNWMVAQDWFDGSGGLNGFPHHYFRKNGFNLFPDISTIDWAMCAAGIRFVRQKYSSDSNIVTAATTLLERPKWEKALGSDGRIVMGFDGVTGNKNNYRWGLAFSEETELVYLEALASGKLDKTILSKVIRTKKSGFYPSWFGSGFTYNWLQLWTGTLSPYATNSTRAFQEDLKTSRTKLGGDYMGLTACFTMKELSSSGSGYVNWSRYISNQGSDISGASVAEVIQISPSPYGAALALPFVQSDAVGALWAYVDLGYYHPILGLPDTMRMTSLQELEVPVPNWNQTDLTMGPLVMAIEQVQNNSIATYFLKDTEIKTALDDLVQSFKY